MSLDILFAQYHNIGPFKNNFININFKNGKYLIKAPIGRGKSFLFFDGPLYGLYKYSQRNILNKKSTSGFIKLIFSIGPDIYLIQRTLKSTKSGNESTKTRLFKLIGNLNIDQKEILTFSEKENKIIDKNREEIPFKSDTELQKTLDSILPPKEVFISTFFLLQDSQNIFELTPSQRIEIFKNIFGLIGIDEFKDKLSERKKEISLQIKQLSSEELWKNKFFNILNKLEKNYNLLNTNIPYLNTIINDFSLFKENFNFYSLNINDLEKINIDTLLINIEQKLSEIIKQKTIYEEKLSQLKQLENELNKLENNKKSILIQIQNYEKKISSFDKNKLDKLKIQKENILKEIDNLHKQILTNFIKGDSKLLKYENLYEQWESNIKNKDINQLYQIIIQIGNIGKTLKKEKENLEKQIQIINFEYETLKKDLQQLEIKPGTLAYEKLQNLLNKEKNILEKNIQKIQNEIEKLIQKQEHIQSQINQLKNQKQQLENALQKETTFLCDKINSNCPYIEKIKGNSLKPIKEQVNLLEKEKINLETKLKQINSQINHLKTDLHKETEKIKNLNIEKLPQYYEFTKKYQEKKQELEKFNLKEKTKKINQQIYSINQTMQNLRNFLLQINYSEIKKLYTTFQEKEKILKTLDKQLLDLEKLQEEIQKYQNEITNLKGQLNTLEIQIKEISNKNNNLKTEINKLQKSINFEEEKILINKKNILLTIKELLSKLKDLIKEYNEAKIQIEKLKEKEKIYSNLQNILSKELMILVLQEFLPKLEASINTILQDIVDYNILFHQKETKSGKLELEIYAEDEKGIRQIKSLSGGQKTVLKLAWILSVSVIMKNKFLFLDETINNLDADSVAKVARMLKKFIKKTNLKFYVVSHSQQIHDMNIWDQIITL